MANPEALAMLRIARMRAAEPAFRLCAELNANLGGLSAPISELRRRLLALWHENGRHTIPQKVGADGCPAGRWRAAGSLPDLVRRGDASSQTTQAHRIDGRPVLSFLGFS